VNWSRCVEQILIGEFPAGELQAPGEAAPTDQETNDYGGKKE
jgi:hypothetical protein